MEEIKVTEGLPEKPASYGEDSIRVLEGLEAVRMRPAMYIGDVGERGLHHLINEVVDNSIDEALAGYCKTIIVTIHTDGSCSVQDDGRGIPTGPHPVKKISTLEVVMCTLHAGGKFDKNTYKVSGGLHGVGVSCVNALSDYMEAIIKISGKIYRQEYSEGKPVSSVEIIGDTSETGTFVRFHPDASIFQTIEFKLDKTTDRLRELAFLNPGVIIIVRDERADLEEIFDYKGGLVDFVEYVDAANTALTSPVFVSGFDSDYETHVEVCFQYNTSYSDTVLSYVNNIHTVEGGTHVSGFRSALTRTFNTYATNVRKTKTQLQGDDFREGLTAIISVKVPEPLFEGQTKTKLGNSEIEGIVRTIVNDKLSQFLDSNPNEAKKIIDKAIQAAEARMAAKKSRDLVRRKNALESTTLPGKLADCSSNIPEECELYIVEGDSAGGSAKQGRDRRFQAILPLKGKILNVQKAQAHKILENEEIRTMITAIGAGFSFKSYDEDPDGLDTNSNHGVRERDFDPDKSRYGKIILMADADVDGSHIRTLLLTFFFRHMRELIYRGKLFIAQPPLFKIKKGKDQVYYAFNDQQRNEVIERLRKDNPKYQVVENEIEENGEDSPDTQEAETGKISGGIVISRFKGLGEMNPDQLWDTTMDPTTRTLLKVTIEDAVKASMLFQILMGDKVEPRRDFIEKHAHYVKNLDV